MIVSKFTLLGFFIEPLILVICMNVVYFYSAWRTHAFGIITIVVGNILFRFVRRFRLCQELANNKTEENLEKLLDILDKTCGPFDDIWDRAYNKAYWGTYMNETELARSVFGERFVEFFSMGDTSAVYAPPNETLEEQTSALPALLATSQIQHVRAKNVLEVGSAKGELSMMCAFTCPNTQFLGVELDKKQVKYANEEVEESEPELPNCKFAVGNMLCLKDTPEVAAVLERGEKFGVIMSRETLCLLETEENQKRVFEDFATMLEPNGRLVVIDAYDPPDLEDLLEDEEEVWSEANRRMHLAVGRASAFPPVMDAAKAAGFRCVSTRLLREPEDRIPFSLALAMYIVSPALGALWSCLVPTTTLLLNYLMLGEYLDEQELASEGDYEYIFELVGANGDEAVVDDGGKQDE